MRMGPQEWLIVLAIVLLIFGPKQIPKLAKMFGKATKDLKDGMNGTDEDDNTDSVKATQTKKEKEVDGE